jgi:hypothetical protein
MRLLKREDEGGLTIADWHGGFIGIVKNGHGLGHFRVWNERCPCCKGAFDVGIEALGFEFIAYNDGDSCELEAYIEDYQQDLAGIQAVG